MIILETALWMATFFLAVSLFLALYRLMKGPSLADRVVALDLISMILAGKILIYILLSGETIYLDAIVVLAVIAFFGTVAFARYIEKGSTK
jgi:multicomponent Na+:H+ antiporter subunit F